MNKKNYVFGRGASWTPPPKASLFWNMDNQKLLQLTLRNNGGKKSIVSTINNDCILKKYHIIKEITKIILMEEKGS